MENFYNATEQKLMEQFNLTNLTMGDLSEVEFLNSELNVSVDSRNNEFGHINFFDPSTSATIQFILCGVLLTTVGFLGVVGNILSILVLSQKKIHASLTVLLIGLSICDLFVCVLYIVLKGLPTLFKYLNIWTPYILFICVPKKYIFPCLQTVQLGSTYFTVAITFERFIAVFRPLESRSICTFKKAIQLSVLIALFSILSNSLNFYTHFKRQEIANYENQTCTSIAPKDISQGVKNARLLIYVLIHILIPLVVVILINTVIVKKIHSNNAERGNFTQIQLKEIKLTNMLVVVVLVYVICNIFRVCNSFTNNILGVTYTEIVSVTDFLVSVNSAVNYLIYCAYGKSFRQSFVKMFCKCGKDSKRIGTQRRGTEETTSDNTEMWIIKSVRKYSKDVINSFGKSKNYNVRPSSKRQPE